MRLWAENRIRPKTQVGLSTALKADLELSLSNLKVELLKWMFGALIAQGGLIVALSKLL